MAKWFYFISNKENIDNGFLSSKSGPKVGSNAEAFKKLALTNELCNEYWGGIRDYLKNDNTRKSGISYGVDINDEIFISRRICDMEANVEIIGYAIVEEINLEEKEIFLNFDEERSKRYSANPEKVTINRKGAFSNLLPYNDVIQNAEQYEKLILDETMNFIEGNTIRANKLDLSEVRLAHDEVLKIVKDFFEHQGYKTGKSNCTIDPKTDLICEKNNRNIIVEVKTNEYGKSKNAVREAFAQLYEYQWLLKKRYKELNINPPILLSAFQNKPDDLSIEFLESHNVMVIWIENKKIRAKKTTENVMNKECSIII